MTTDLAEKTCVNTRPHRAHVWTMADIDGDYYSCPGGAADHFPGDSERLSFASRGAHPVDISMGWDGENLVVWVEMGCGDMDDDVAEFGIGGFHLTGADVRAVANFEVTENQAREWRDALTRLVKDRPKLSDALDS